jgi:hypothetical protein
MHVVIALRLAAHNDTGVTSQAFKITAGRTHRVLAALRWRHCSKQQFTSTSTSVFNKIMISNC